MASGKVEGVPLAAKKAASYDSRRRAWPRRRRTTKAARAFDTVPEVAGKSEAPPPLPVGASVSVWSLSSTATGSRAVQQLLHDAESDAARKYLADGLRGHVWAACHCPHANHVLQKCISDMKPAQLDFVVDEILAAGPRAGARLARHKYGCRVLQRLFEHSHQTSGIAEHLLAEVSRLSAHQYGTYVMRSLAEHGAEEHRQPMVKALIRFPKPVVFSLYGPPVLRQVLLFADAEDRQHLSSVILNLADVPRLVQTRRGAALADCLMELVDDPSLLYQLLREDLTNFNTSRYSRAFGRRVEHQHWAFWAGIKPLFL